MRRPGTRVIEKRKRSLKASMRAHRTWSVAKHQMWELGHALDHLEKGGGAWKMRPKSEGVSPNTTGQDKARIRAKIGCRIPPETTESGSVASNDGSGTASKSELCEAGMRAHFRATPPDSGPASLQPHLFSRPSTQRDPPETDTSSTPLFMGFAHTLSTKCRPNPSVQHLCWRELLRPATRAPINRLPRGQGWGGPPAPLLINAGKATTHQQPGMGSKFQVKEAAMGANKTR